MVRISLFLLSILPQASIAQSFDNTSVKRFYTHLRQEPLSLDPTRLGTQPLNILYHNLNRGLYRYHAEKGLILEGAKKCVWQSPKQLRCELSPNHKWSNGERVKAEDYVRAFRYWLNPKTKSRRYAPLLVLKNAKEVVQGQQPLSQLGIVAKSTFTLEFHLESPDREFLYALSSPRYGPIYKLPLPKTNLVSSGPYILEEWQPRKEIRIKPNPHYQNLSSQPRPPVGFYFVADDSTALSLYKKNLLHHLRRIPPQAILAYKKRADFRRHEILRLDYLGFGPEMRPFPNLRKAMTHALDYSELQKIFDAPSPPGCPAIPPRHLNSTQCHKYNLSLAHSHWEKVPREIRKKRYKRSLSQQGGDYHRRLGEWLQAQWRKNLGLKVDILQIESKYFFALLRKSPPRIFRKGVPASLPTCTSVLKTFLPQSAGNYIRWNNQDFVHLVGQMKNQLPEQKKASCLKAIEMLLSSYQIIPQGRMFFDSLWTTEVAGLFVNEMQQVDFSQLHWK